MHGPARCMTEAPVSVGRPTSVASYGARATPKLDWDPFIGLWERHEIACSRLRHRRLVGQTLRITGAGRRERAMNVQSLSGLRESMTFAARALGALEKIASIAGRIDDLAAFEARLLILRSRLSAGSGGPGLLAEVRLFVLQFEAFILECWD